MWPFTRDVNDSDRRWAEYVIERQDAWRDVKTLAARLGVGPLSKQMDTSLNMLLTAIVDRLDELERTKLDA